MAEPDISLGANSTTAACNMFRLSRIQQLLNPIPRGQFDALARGPFDVRGLCHRHRLHGNGRTAAYLHVADADAYGLVQPDGIRTRAAHSTNHTG